MQVQMHIQKPKGFYNEDGSTICAECADETGEWENPIYQEDIGKYDTCVYCGDLLLGEEVYLCK